MSNTQINFIIVFLSVPDFARKLKVIDPEFCLRLVSEKIRRKLIHKRCTSDSQEQRKWESSYNGRE